MANKKGVQTKGTKNRENSALDSTRTLKGTPVAREMQNLSEKDIKQIFQATLTQLEKVAVARADIDAYRGFAKTMRGATFAVEDGALVIRDNTMAERVYNIIHTTISSQPEVGAYTAEELRDGEKLIKALSAYANVCQQSLTMQTQRANAKAEEVALLKEQVANLEASVASLTTTVAERDRTIAGFSTYVAPSTVEAAKKKGKKMAAWAVAAGIAAGAVAGGVAGAAIGASNQANKDAAALQDANQQVYVLKTEKEELLEQIEGMLSVLADANYQVSKDMTMEELAEAIAKKNSTEVNNVYNDILSQFEALGLDVASLKDENGNFNKDLVDAKVAPLVESLVEDMQNVAFWENTLNGMLGKTKKEDGSTYSTKDFRTQGEAWNFVYSAFATKVDDMLGQIAKPSQAANGAQVAAENVEYYSLADFGNDVGAAVEFLGECAANSDSPQLKAQIETLQQQNTTLTSDYQQSQADLLKALSDLETAQAKNAELMGENSDLRQQHEVAEQNLKTTKDELDKTQAALTQANADLAEARQQITELNGQIKELNDQITQLEATIADLNGQISTLEGDKATLEGQVTDLQGKLTAAEQRAADYERQIGECNQELEQLRKDGRPEDKQKIKDLEQQVATLEDAYQTAQNTITIYEGQIAAKDAQIESLDNKIAQLEATNNDWAAKYQASQQQIGSLTEQLNAAVKRAETAEGQVTEYKAQSDENWGKYLDAVEEANELRQQLNNQTTNENAGQPNPTNPEAGGHNSQVGSEDNDDDPNKNPGGHVVNPDENQMGGGK